MPFRIASWNVNSITVRLQAVLDWLQSSQVDILGLQELKTPDEKFPLSAFQDTGYSVYFNGQKTYNGVAWISKTPLTNILCDIPNYNDPQRRFISAEIPEENIQLINVYVPNGGELNSDKYQYKLTWLTAFQHYIEKTMQTNKKLIIVGDFNIAPSDQDVYDPLAWEGQVLVSPPERKAFQNLLNTGLYDSFRLFEQADKSYTWWDYRQFAFRRNRGLRIDHILISEALRPHCKTCHIDSDPRKQERPSDHTPIVCQLSTLNPTI